MDSVVQEIIDKIMAMYNDTSFSPERAMERLQIIRDEIDVLIDAIPDE